MSRLSGLVGRGEGVATSGKRGQVLNLLNLLVIFYFLAVFFRYLAIMKVVHRQL
jgi:hypothetical protein